MRTTTQAEWKLDSSGLLDAYTDFILSRQAMQCSRATLEFYKYTTRPFLRWVEAQGLTTPQEISARYVRQYLAGLRDRGLQDSSIADHARAIRTLLNFWTREKYLTEPVHFELPRVAKKRLPVLTIDELRTILAACHKSRDKALIMLMVDSGLRRAEVCALDWPDLDFSNGLIRVRRGKGGKARSAVVGPATRRALLAYRRMLANASNSGPMFLSQKGGRLTLDGLGLVFWRLTQTTGIHVTAHSLRRTFVILSLRAGMSLEHLRALGGWSGFEMLSRYAQVQDEDLLQGHREHGPLDGVL